MNMSLSKLWEIVDREAWCAAVRGIAKSWTEWLNNNIWYSEAPLIEEDSITFTFGLVSSSLRVGVEEMKYKFISE